jgi:hypothetical protein
LNKIIENIKLLKTKGGFLFFKFLYLFYGNFSAIHDQASSEHIWKAPHIFWSSSLDQQPLFSYTQLTQKRVLSFRERMDYFSWWGDDCSRVMVH